MGTATSAGFLFSVVEDGQGCNPNTNLPSRYPCRCHHWLYEGCCRRCGPRTSGSRSHCPCTPREEGGGGPARSGPSCSDSEERSGEERFRQGAVEEAQLRAPWHRVVVIT